jgi:hypothetical protein
LGSFQPPFTAKNIQDRIERLKASPQWKGPETPLFTTTRGVVLSYQTIYRHIRKAGALMGHPEPVRPHTLRKSVGTHMGKRNEVLAREQLGITDKVFKKHYFQPTVDDRIERRDLLLDATWEPEPAPDQRLLRAYKDLEAGTLTREKFNVIRKQIELETATARSKVADQDYFA